MSGGDARRRPRPVGLTIPFDLICPMIAIFPLPYKCENTSEPCSVTQQGKEATEAEC